MKQAQGEHSRANRLLSKFVDLAELQRPERGALSGELFPYPLIHGHYQHCMPPIRGVNMFPTIGKPVPQRVATFLHKNTIKQDDRKRVTKAV